MLKLPVSPTPKQFKVIEDNKNNKILRNFIIRVNNDMNDGYKDFFDLPNQAYSGFMVDVRKHFEEYGWEAKLNDKKIKLKKL